MATPLQTHLTRYAAGCGSTECQRAKHIVLCRGTVPCDILLVGEAPGESEDVLGKPFVGVAGKLQDRMLRDAWGGAYKLCFTNLVGCIPREEDGSKATEPSDEQVLACQPRLQHFIDRVAKPRLIVCVGTHAKDWLNSGYRHGLKPQRKTPMVNVLHPAFIIRQNIAQRMFLIQQVVAILASAADEYLEENVE